MKYDVTQLAQALGPAMAAGADLAGADLRGADLRGADLREADLRADLREADDAICSEGEEAHIVGEEGR